ncbi:glycosyltransferase [Lachnoclostridium phytofermentans]|uniref:glycosyltransferase n=1 Tax=Lachnoclostridium phytofermentans TaxID=66219 RepID=UPI00055561B8|nr:glycosyltransferase [Lachnoclostridium phytofermentans]
MKVLMIASVASMIKQFNMNNISLLQKLGFEVEIACNFLEGNACDLDSIEVFKKDLKKLKIIYHQIDFPRKIYDVKNNYNSFKQLLELYYSNSYNLIYCQTPIGGALARLSLIKIKEKRHLKIIYAAHGFHFFKGSSLISWFVYFPIEKFLAHYTDILITINSEDYDRSKKFKLPSNGKTIYVPGVGINLSECIVSNKENTKKKLLLNTNAFILLSIGELTKRKNHEVVIRAVYKLVNTSSRKIVTLLKYLNEEKVDEIKKRLVYVICGMGKEELKLKKLVNDLQLNKYIKFLGYQSDVKEILMVSDAFIFPSRQEGLPVALMEAMAFRLPIICSDIRGNKDLIKNQGGIMLNPCNVDNVMESIIRIYTLEEKQKRCMIDKNYNTLSNFSENVVNKQMYKIFSDIKENLEERTND